MPPEVRFRRAVAEHALEPSRPLPGRFAALAMAVTGQAETPRFTTGWRTRHALHGAGARAATTGRTLHLPGPPQATPQGLEVLAHELAHVAESGRAPRFLLGALPHGADAGERRAHAIGDAVRAAAGAGHGPALPFPPAPGGVAGLPVGGGANGGGGGLAQAAREAAQLAVAEALGSAAPGPGTGGGAEEGTAPRVTANAEGTITAGMSMPNAGITATTTTPASGGSGESQVARLMEQLEERVLEEIERRGGRYAGVF